MFLQKINPYKKDKRGFTLIELAIVLAVTSLLTVGLWRMMASGNTQLRDQAAADQHKQLIAAVKGYLASADGKSFLFTNTGNFNIALDCSTGHASFCANFRPEGFSPNTRNSYGQQYEIRVRNTSAVNTEPSFYSFMIKTFGGELIPDSSGGRISSLIGADGGFVYGADLCGGGSANTIACGAFGGWTANPNADYGYGNTTGGQIASRTFAGGVASTETPWLARLNIDGDGNAANGIDEYNTIQTDTSLAGNSLFGLLDGTASYGGGIDRIGHIDVGRDVNDGVAIPLEVQGACSIEDDPTPASCDTAVGITGDVTVLGRVTAAAVYGARYIYDLSADVSDRRLKKDLQPITDALGKLASLTGYKFTRKDTGKVKYGVMSDDVEKVFPELVVSIDNEYQGVDYMGLIGPLVAAVNELKAQNEAMKAEIETLKKALPQK